MALPFIEYILANSEHQKEVAYMQAMIEGYKATDCDLREQFKKEGAMATVAFVCGRQLVVAPPRWHLLCIPGYRLTNPHGETLSLCCTM